MKRKPRPLKAPILNRLQWLRLTILGLLMATGVLLVRDRAEAEYDVLVASTMLLMTSSIYILANLDV
jgi:hypothetical protein